MCQFPVYGVPSHCQEAPEGSALLWNERFIANFEQHPKQFSEFLFVVRVHCPMMTELVSAVFYDCCLIFFVFKRFLIYHKNIFIDWKLLWTCSLAISYFTFISLTLKLSWREHFRYFYASYLYNVAHEPDNEQNVKLVSYDVWIHLTRSTQVISGGVASNMFARKLMSTMCSHYNCNVVCPPPHLCTDNGLMIAWLVLLKLHWTIWFCILIKYF